MTSTALRPTDGSQRLLDDRYRLIRPIGSGGMSVVWQGFDEVLGREVAVKQLAASLGADPQFPRRLLAEARAVAALNHPHITGVYDFGVHRSSDEHWTPYLVLELLDGQLLSDVLRRGALPWREAVTVCSQLASALQAAHDHGIVHRDVTPGNVMLTSSGVKVLDFGIAALIGDNQREPNGDLFGTAAYLAPERLISGQITAAVDIYGAGLVLYKCLTGQLPWPAKTLTDMLYAHAHVQPYPLRLPGLPQAVEEICYQCLFREPDHRPSAAELTQVLAHEVQRIDVATVRLGQLRDQPTGHDGFTRTLSLAAPRRRHLRARRVLAGTIALLGAIVLGYLLRSTGPQPVSADQATTAAPCSVTYAVTPARRQQFAAVLTVTNTSQQPVTRWTLQFTDLRGYAVDSIATVLAQTSAAATISVTHTGQQPQTVTITGTSTLDVGGTAIQALSGRHTGQPAATPSTFTLNGKRCDATIVVGPPVPSPAATRTVGQTTNVDNTTPGKDKPKKPHGKQPPHLSAA